MFLEPTEQMPVNEAAAAGMANPELFREQVNRHKQNTALFSEISSRHLCQVVGRCNVDGSK